MQTEHANTQDISFFSGNYSALQSLIKSPPCLKLT